jgi:uncharacterized protein YjbI with pentapeptide repeats
VIGRRKLEHEEGEKDHTLDLRETDLRGAYLRDARLEGAHLEGADLRYAINLTRDQVESAHCYTKKQLPEDLRNLADLEDRPHDVDESHQTEAEA